MHTVERYHDISTGHRVCNHESKCAHLHGHNYRITFVCEPEHGTLDGIGRVIDFSVVKERLCMWLEEHWDHKFLIWDCDPLRELLCTADPRGVVLVRFNPTAENMAEHLVNVVAPQQLRGTGVVCRSVRIEETRKCSATYNLETQA